MPKYDVATGVAVTGLAGFQVWEAWRQSAPSFQDLRHATPGDVATQQALLDASLATGTLAASLGIAFFLFTGDATPLAVMLAILGILAAWSYQILAADSR